MGKKGKSENVQVIVRVRPLNKKELAGGNKDCTHLDLAANTICVDGAGVDGRPFAFDAIYNNSFSQKDVYLQSIHPVVETVIQGFNATIFAYGQSGTGKTFSMAGVLGDKELQGIIPNALNHIFEFVTNNNTDKMAITVNASFVELYNGKCRDLLVDGRNNLELKENSQKLFYVKDLSNWDISCTEQAMKLMDAGLARREVKSTDLNADSSRSHSLFTVYVRCHDKVNDVRTESKLNLVDLAGSERQSKSGATGETLVEGNNINLSLTALGTVIDCLVKQKPHIPYRSSPLTMLLKDGLGGNSRTIIVGTCSPSESNNSETVSTLRFLDRAKQIKNKPKIQMDPKDAKIAELMEEIKVLKQRLGIDEGQEIDDDGPQGVDEESREKYIKSFDSEMEALKRRIEELEVAQQFATDATEAAQREAAQAAVNEQRLREKFTIEIEELKLQAQRQKDEAMIHNVADGEFSEQLNQLVDLCAKFIQSNDPSHSWKLPEKKKKKHQIDNVFEEIAAGFRLLESAGISMKVQEAMVRRQSSLGFVSPPKGQGPFDNTGGTVPAVQPLFTGAQQVTSPTKTNSHSQLQPHSTAPTGGAASSVNLLPAVRPNSVSPPPSAPSATPPLGEEMEGKKNKKEKKEKKKEKKEKKEREHEKERAMEINCLPQEQIKETLKLAGLLDANNLEANTNETLIDTVNDLLEKQRLLLHAQMMERLKDGGAVANPKDAAELVAAYESAVDDVNRLRQQVTKAKTATAKVKEVADKRALEIDKMKEHVDALREELAAKHAQHAGEMALQQDQLVTQHNKKTEALVAKHSKALVKEKKQREKLQTTIDELEDKVSVLEQQYDVKVMEYEALQQNFEQSRIDALKKYKDLSSGYSTVGGGMTAGAAILIEDETDRLRRAVARNNSNSTAMSPLVGLNTSYPQGQKPNEQRSFSVKSAPDSVQFPSVSPGGNVPMPPSAGDHAPTFSRNFLDVPRQ